MFQVYANETYYEDHVGSPRAHSRDYWGATFEDRAACQAACDALYHDEFPRFLIVYPREVAEPQGVVNAVID